MRNVDYISIGFEPAHGDDVASLCVCNKTPTAKEFGFTVEIINILFGEEAEQLYNKLIGNHPLPVKEQ